MGYVERQVIGESLRIHALCSSASPQQVLLPHTALNEDLLYVVLFDCSSLQESACLAKKMHVVVILASPALKHASPGANYGNSIMDLHPRRSRASASKLCPFLRAMRSRRKRSWGRKAKGR